MFRLVVTGNSIKELAANAQKLIDEANGFVKETKVHHMSQSETEKIMETGQVELPAEDTNATINHKSVVAPSSSQKLDSRGVPWDARIHSATQAVNTDGSWRNRRGVEKEMVRKIEAELVAQPVSNVPVPSVPLAPSQPIQQPLQVVPPIPVSPSLGDAGEISGRNNEVATVPGIPAAPTTYQAPGPTPAPVSTPPIAPPILDLTTATHTVATFKQHLVQILNDLVVQGKLTPEYINGLKQHFKVEQIWQVNEAQANEMFEFFAANGLIKKAVV